MPMLDKGRQILNVIAVTNFVVVTVISIYGVGHVLCELGREAVIWADEQLAESTEE